MLEQPCNAASGVGIEQQLHLMMSDLRTEQLPTVPGHNGRKRCALTLAQHSRGVYTRYLIALAYRAEQARIPFRLRVNNREMAKRTARELYESLRASRANHTILIAQPSAVTGRSCRNALLRETRTNKDGVWYSMRYSRLAN